MHRRLEGVPPASVTLQPQCDLGLEEVDSCILQSGSCCISGIGTRLKLREASMNPVPKHSNARRVALQPLAAV